MKDSIKIYLPAETKKVLKSEAKEKGFTMNGLFIKIIDEYLKKKD